MTPYRSPSPIEYYPPYRHPPKVKIFRVLLRMRLFFIPKLRRHFTPCCGVKWGCSNRLRQQYRSGRCPKCRLAWAYS